jgi:hypothetical protein
MQAAGSTARGRAGEARRSGLRAKSLTWPAFVAVDSLAAVFSAGRLVSSGSESKLAPPTGVATESSDLSELYSLDFGDSTCAGIVSLAQHARTDEPTIRRKRQTHLAGRFVVVACRVASVVDPRQFREPLLVFFGITGAGTSRERGSVLDPIVHTAAAEARRAAPSPAGLWLRRRLDSFLLGRLAVPIPVRQLAALSTNSALCTVRRNTKVRRRATRG